MQGCQKILIFFLLAFTGCTSWKAGLNNHGNYDIAIKNAIIDFSHTSKLFKKDNTFSIAYKDDSSGILYITLMGTVGKFIIATDGKTSTFPTRYLEYNDKLFYWYDKNYPLSEIIKNKLKEFDLIDSVESIADAEFIIDDSKSSVDYYFCKNELLHYTKVKTNLPIGRYKSPKLNCNENK
jgi:hypothetical protein